MEGWENHSNELIQFTLPRSMSDHSPILLDGGEMRHGNIPFRFEKMWLEVDGFKDLFKSWWKGYYFIGSCTFILVSELKALKSYLKVWNKVVFDNVFIKREMTFN